MESTIAGGAPHAQQTSTAPVIGTAHVSYTDATAIGTTLYADANDAEQANLQRRLKGCSSSGASNVPWSHQKVLVQTKQGRIGSSSSTAPRSTVSWELKPRHATLENSKHILRRREARRIEQDNDRMQQKLTAIYQAKHTGKPFASQDCSKGWQQRTAVYDQAPIPGTATLVPRSTLRRSTSAGSSDGSSLVRSSSCGSRVRVMRSSTSVGGGASSSSHGITKTLAFAACAGA